MSLIEQLKQASQVGENMDCRVSKTTLLQAIKAVRALENIASTSVGANWPAEAVRMREEARRGLE